MVGFGWIMTIIIGGLAGWIAEKLMKFDTGLIMNIVLGVIGAIVANYLSAKLLHVVYTGFVGQLIAAVVGACILIFAYKLIKGRA